MLSSGPERVVAGVRRRARRRPSRQLWVLGRPDREAVYAAAERATERLGIPVNTTVRSPQAWALDSDALVITAKADARIVLDTDTVTP